MVETGVRPTGQSRSWESSNKPDSQEEARPEWSGTGQEQGWEQVRQRSNPICRHKNQAASDLLLSLKVRPGLLAPFSQSSGPAN